MPRWMRLSYRNTGISEEIMAIDTPFKGTVGRSEVPKRGSSGTYDKEPHFPGRARTGGMLPEKLRDDITPKTPGFISPNKTDMIWGK